MKKILLPLLLLAIGNIGAQAQAPTAQEQQELEAKYTKDLLPVGTMAPDFVIKKAKENNPALSLSDYRTHTEGTLNRPGCYVLLDFWATWCPDCRREIPTVKDIYQKYRTKVKLIGVSMDTDKEKLKEFAKSQEMKWSMYSEFKKWKETHISQDYHIQWLPTMYLIDPEGKVAYCTITAQNMVKKLEELDQAGKLSEYYKKPQFPGGSKAWLEALDDNISYPDIASKYKGEAKMKINFTVGEDGTLSDIEVKAYKGSPLSGKYYEALSQQQKEDAQVAVQTALSQEVIKAIQKMANLKWIPAEERGKSVKARHGLNFTFHIPSKAFKKGF